MKPDAQDPERLSNAALTSDSERFAADVLRAVGEPPAPDVLALERVRRRLGARIAARRPFGMRRFLRPALVTAAIVVTAGAVLAARGLLRARNEGALRVPAGTVARFGLRDGRVALAGRAVARIEGDGALILDEGTLALATGQQPAVISRGDVNVRVAPHSVARAAVASGRETAFAVVTGSLKVERSGAAIDVAAGYECRDGKCAELGATESESVRRLLDPASAPEPVTAEPAAPVPVPVTPTGGDKPSSLNRVWTRPPPARPVRTQLTRRVPASVSSSSVVALAPEPAESESHLLAQALRKLRQEHDARGALELLDRYSQRFAGGRLAPEAALGRIEALMTLGRHQEALRLIESTPALPLGRETTLLRGELRASAGRCQEAIADFGAALSATPRDGLDDRALFGRAFCRARGGDRAGGRAELERYLSIFPKGSFAVEARRALEQP